MNDNVNEIFDENKEINEIGAETELTQETEATDTEETSEQSDVKEGDSEENLSNSPGEIDALREELMLLRAELEEKKNELERLGKEISEFSELFPNEQISSLPDSVWERVKEGVPLAAAYALFKRKAELRAEQASITNQKNNKMSTGAIGRDTTDSFYTPDEVRAMSRSEIKKNYSKILDSMKKWN